MRILKRLAAAAAAVCLAFTALGTSAVFAASAPGEEFAVSTENVTLHGKYFSKADGYAFSYGSAGISANFTGSEFWIYVPEVPMEGTTVRNVGIAVLVDTDMPMEAEMFTIDKSGWICVASGLSSGEHSITIRKQSRGFFGIMASDWFCVSKVGLASGGKLLTPDPLSDLVVEVYGDSISNGDAVWKTETGNEAYTYGNYTGVIERLLDAEVRVCGNTGNGLLGWVMGEANGQLDNLLPPQNCWSVIDSQAANEPYSHEGANAADVVIINLGTNDRRELGNGDMTTDMFHDEYLRFVKEIKTDCPDAIVICTLGAMGGINEFGETLQRVAANANAWNNGETFCYFFELQQCNTIMGGLGYDNGHPSNLAHEIYGLQLSTLINEALGLNKTLPEDIPEEAFKLMVDAGDPLKFGTAVDCGVAVYGDGTADAHVADRVIDGNMTTGWQLGKKTDMGENCWVGVMFDTTVSIDNITIAWEDATRPTKDGKGYRIEYTADGETWKAVSGAKFKYGTPEGGNNYSEDLVTFTKVEAKGIRVVVLASDNNKDYAPQIFEMSAESDGTFISGDSFMSAATGRTDDLSRVEAAVKGENITVEPDDDIGTNPGPSSEPETETPDTSSQPTGTVSDGRTDGEEDGGSGAVIAIIVVAVVVVAVVAVVAVTMSKKKKKA